MTDMIDKDTQIVVSLLLIYLLGLLLVCIIGGILYADKIEKDKKVEQGNTNWDILMVALWWPLVLFGACIFVPPYLAIRGAAELRLWIRKDPK